MIKMPNWITVESKRQNLIFLSEVMSKNCFKIVAVTAFVFIFSGYNLGQQQTEKPKNINFGYSKNPSTKPKNQTRIDEGSSQKPETVKAEKSNSGNQTIAQKTLEIAKKASSRSAPPTEIYKVGAGDILFISLQNAPPKDSTYFTVLNDGTIDYPLAGKLVSVAGLTTEEIEDLLREKITLYENPKISVRVRDYASHKINVLGLVENAGEKYLQREAIPLYVIKAEAVVQPRANQVVIRRADSQVETLNLSDTKTDEVLILPGDIVEFSSSQADLQNVSGSQFYFIGGAIAAPGQKAFHQGLTLSQAILAAGGLRKLNVKTVVVRRKNSEGLLVTTEYNLKGIKDGKVPDPLLEAGDTIEVGN